MTTTTKITWAKARNTIRKADCMYLYSDGSLLLRTEETHRGAKVDIWTLIEGFVPAFVVRRYLGDNFGTDDVESARIVFFSRSGNKGALTLSRPTKVRVWAGDGSQTSKAQGVGHAGMEFTYANGDKIEFGYLTSPEVTYRDGKLTTFSAYLVSNDFEIQTGVGSQVSDLEINERFTLDDKNG